MSNFNGFSDFFEKLFSNQCSDCYYSKPIKTDNGEDSNNYVRCFGLGYKPDSRLLCHDAAKYESSIWVKSDFFCKEWKEKENIGYFAQTTLGSHEATLKIENTIKDGYDTSDLFRVGTFADLPIYIKDFVEFKE